MKAPIFCSLICTFIALTSIAQTNVDSLLKQADSSYFDYKDYSTALDLYSEAHKAINLEHADFAYITDKIARSLFFLKLDAGKDPHSEAVIDYAQAFIAYAEKYPDYINEAVLEKKYFMVKSLVVAHMGKDDLNGARVHQEALYAAYEKGELPEGLDEYYNFEFFKWEDKNVWGYEWFAPLPEDRLSGSFSKIVYYIYSTHPDGSDKDMLYQLQVLMFHKRDDATTFDYVLTKRIETATEETGGTLYSYTYNDPIDLVKLRKDIREVVGGKWALDTKFKVKM